MSMFAPSSPAASMQTRSAARTRYNSDTPASKQHSSSYPPIDPALNNHTTTPTPSRTNTRDHNPSTSVILSPDLTSSSSALSSASPTQGSAQEFAGLHTPFVQHTAPPSASGTPQQGIKLSDDQHQQQASPAQMPAFHHDSPSPPVTYGINANLIVGGGDATNMSSAAAPVCQPLVPGQTDVFMSGKASIPRPVLRSTLSLNAIPTPTTAASSWSRRNVSDEIANGTSASTGAGTRIPAPPVSTESAVLSTYPPNTPLSQQGSVHEASAPFSHPSHPAATHTHTHGHSSSYPHTHHGSSHHMSATGTPYSDQEHSFQSSTYAGSYDSSFSSTSPWTPQSGSDYHHQYHHPYYGPMSNKVEEPILAPGEVPAPRPPMSYAALIGEALLLAAPPHQLYVSEISDSIKRRYPYYRQNPTKVYNGVRHQTSMCKAFVKLPRPFGDQSGGARKWAIRAGCETWFAGGGYHPPGSNAAASMKKASSPPAASGGKAKQTARSKQLAIGTSSSHSPKMSASKVKSEPYLPASMGGGPSVGPAFDGTNKPYYPPYGHAGMPYQHYAPQSSQAPAPNYYPSHGHYYVPIHPGYSQQQPGQNGGGQAYWNPYGSSNPGAPNSPEPSPHMSSAASYPPTYGASYGAYPQPGQPHPYAPTSDTKMYGGMSMPHHPGYPQSSERPDTQGSQGSPGSYEGKPSPNGRDRDNSAELSPRH